MHYSHLQGKPLKRLSTFFYEWFEAVYCGLIMHVLVHCARITARYEYSLSSCTIFHPHFPFKLCISTCTNSIKCVKWGTARESEYVLIHYMLGYRTYHIKAHITRNSCTGIGCVMDTMLSVLHWYCYPDLNGVCKYEQHCLNTKFSYIQNEADNRFAGNVQTHRKNSQAFKTKITLKTG